MKCAFQAVKDKKSEKNQRKTCPFVAMFGKMCYNTIEEIKDKESKYEYLARYFPRTYYGKKL